MSDTEYVKLVNDENANWKKMIPGNMKEGAVYEDSGVTIFGKFNFKKYDGRIILEIQSKGDQLTNVKVSSKIPDGFKMQVSEV